MKERSIFVLFLLLTFALLGAGAFHHVGMELRHTDANWTIALFEDLFVNGGNLSSWNLSQHTDFFPDKIISFVLWGLSPNYSVFYYLYGVVNLFLWFYLVYTVSKNKYVALLSTYVPLIALNFGVLGSVYKYVFWPTLHFNSFCIGVLAYVFYSQKRFKIFSLVILWLVIASDKLIALYLFAIVGGEYLYSFWHGDVKQKISKSILPLVVIFTSIVLQDYIWNHVAFLTKATPLSFTTVLERNLSKVYSIALPLLFIVFIISSKIIYKLTMKKDQKVLFVSVFLCFAVPAMLFPIFFVEPRYIAFSFWVSGAVFFYALYVRKPIAFNICCKLSPLVLLLPVIQFIKTGCIYKPFSDHPLSSCLKEIPDLKEGLGTYWNTHEVNLFGNSKNPIRAVGPNLKPYHWVNNIDWFKNRRFNFIVTNDPSYSIPLENIRNIVKDELKVIQCENIERSVVVLNKKQEMMLYNYLN